MFLLAIAPSFFSILFFDSIFNLIGLGAFEKGIVGVDYPLMGMRTMIAYIVINASCFTFQNIIVSNEKTNDEHLLSLRNNADTIAAQNFQLKMSHEEQVLLNKQLEDLVAQKTENINDQHKTILAYAFSNSHLVRGSVARILGLIEVSKLEANIDCTWYFEKIDHEVKILDKTIRDITDTLNYKKEDA